MGLNKSVIEHTALIIVLTVVSAAQANHEVNSSGKGEVKESCAIINDFRPSADCQKVCRSIVDGILFGDRLKIVKALETHSSFFDELVKARANCLDRPEKAAVAQLALATFGDSRQLKRISCELSVGNALVQEKAFEKLKAVGGWFAIEHALRFLDGTVGRNEMPTDMTGSVSFVSLSEKAIEVLSQVLPEAPPAKLAVASGGPNAVKRIASDWRNWIAEREAALKSLRPTSQAWSSADCAEGATNSQP